MGKGDTYRHVDPKKYEKNYQRMIGLCATCCNFLDDDKGVGEHCSQKCCVYELGGDRDFLDGESDV